MPLAEAGQTAFNMAESQLMVDPITSRGITGTDAFNSGVEEQQSMMQRASALRQSQQMEQMRAQEIQKQQILMPVIKAKAQADQISAVSAVANATRIANLRGQAAAVSKPANDEFLDAMQLADFNEKASALAGLQAKYQWMSLIPEYKGFVDTINDERLKAHGAAVADAKMEEQLTAAQIAQSRAIEVANIGAGARQAVAETTSGARRDVAETNAGARVASATLSAEGHAASRETRIDLAKFKAYQQGALDADKNAAKAQAAGDSDSAALYQKHATEFRSQAEKELAKPAEPVRFNVPGAGASAPEDTPAEEPTAPEDTPAEEPKLYTPPSESGGTPTFTSAVKKPEDVLAAVQQMVNDGVVTPDQARETLRKLGFKPKGK